MLSEDQCVLSDNRERDDVKYVGAVPFRHLYMYISILKLILSLIGSQCNLRRHGVACHISLHDIWVWQPNSGFVEVFECQWHLNPGEDHCHSQHAIKPLRGQCDDTCRSPGISWCKLEVETPTQGFNVCTHGHPAIKHYTEVAYTPCWTDGLVNLK